MKPDKTLSSAKKIQQVLSFQKGWHIADKGMVAIPFPITYIFGKAVMNSVFV